MDVPASPGTGNGCALKYTALITISIPLVPSRDGNKEGEEDSRRVESRCAALFTPDNIAVCSELVMLFDDDDCDSSFNTFIRLLDR